MNASASILVVDDDPQVRGLLVDYLSGHGFNVRGAAGASAARALLADSVPDLVILGMTMPGEDGLTLARHIRERYDTGLIMVTGTGEAPDRAHGREMGADDYVTGPFDPRELLSRAERVLNRADKRDRAQPDGPRQVAFGHCRLDLDTRRMVGPDGGEIPLTSMEFDLLEMFGSCPNRVLSRDQILNFTQNRDWGPFDRSVDIRIARIRKKIEPEPGKPRIIRTVRSAGYMFVPAE